MLPLLVGQAAETALDPSSPLGGNLLDSFMTGGGMIPSSTALSSSSASTRISFATGQFSGGMGLNIKNILLIGGVTLLSIFLYKRVM